ncbi:MAG: FAD-dependent thymidylate synthase [Lachnospiraceae bacterium]|nr:FAD-dependent thymidylate synthase [Lachnospiraceae bacterium]
MIGTRVFGAQTGAMMQQITMVARTFEVTDSQDLKEDMILLSGKAAGVCYMPDDYMDKGIQDIDRARKRAEATARSGHHSVFDHGHLSFILHTNKMMAMILNSVGLYTTSEKSARYTRMQPQTQVEIEIYEKWNVLLTEAILREYPDMLRKEASKLAMENARYLISVFTPTIMEYTVSYRQAHLLVAYLQRLSTSCEKLTDPFHVRIGGDAVELATLLAQQLGDFSLSDSKNQQFRFLEYPINPQGNSTKREVIGDSYTMVYRCSFAALAQLQRHRSLRYSMLFDGQPTGNGWVVPAIVLHAGMVPEWNADMERLSFCYPQGLLVRVTEQGIFEDFALKCKERLCGRVQLEAMNTTIDAVRKFLSHRDWLCETNQLLLDSMTGVNRSDSSSDLALSESEGIVAHEFIEQQENFVLGVPYPRCCFHDYTCTQGCRWGAKEAFTRLV